MSDKIEQTASRMLRAIDDCKNGLITKEELRSKMYQAAAELEGDQWKIIENLRARAPASERALAREVADAMEAELRKGSSNA